MKALQRLVLGLATAWLLVLAASCSYPAHGPSIEIRGDSWSAVPAAMDVDGASFNILVSNLGTTREEFVVVHLTGADPDALPMRDGQLDMTFNESTFYVTFPEPMPNEGRLGGAAFALVPEPIDPDEDKQVTIGSFKGGGEPATFVVMSCEKGGYAAAHYAVFTITR